MAKLLPLFALVLVGALFIDPVRFAAPPPLAESSGLIPAAMAGLFACTGFEFVAVPAGETRDPARAVPLALLGSLGGAVLLYALVQVVAVGATPDLGSAQPALVVTARAIAGGPGATIMTVGALVSTFGFCASSVLVGPSYLAAFADDGMAPAPLGRRLGNGAPAVAVLTWTVSAALLGHLGNFERLATIANIAVVAQYVPTCVAVLVLRRTRPAARRGFRLPLGPLVPLAALAGCGLFLSAVAGEEAKVAAEILAVGFALRIVFVAARRLVRGARARQVV
jgi:amino acid transporter